MRSNGIEERERTGRGHHPVARVNVVLDQDGNAVQRATRSPCTSLLVESTRDVQSVGIEFDDRIQMGTFDVNRSNSFEIFPCQGDCRFAPGLDQAL